MAEAELPKNVLVVTTTQGVYQVESWNPPRDLIPSEEAPLIAAGGSWFVALTDVDAGPVLVNVAMIESVQDRDPVWVRGAASQREVR